MVLVTSDEYVVDIEAEDSPLRSVGTCPVDAGVVFDPCESKVLEIVVDEHMPIESRLVESI